MFRRRGKKHKTKSQERKPFPEPALKKMACIELPKVKPGRDKPGGKSCVGTGKPPKEDCGQGGGGSEGAGCGWI